MIKKKKWWGKGKEEGQGEGGRDTEALLSQEESPININGNKELKVKVLIPNLCSFLVGEGQAERGCQNGGIGRVLFVLFPGAGVGVLPEGSARKSSFLPQSLRSGSVTCPRHCTVLGLGGRVRLEAAYLGNCACCLNRRAVAGG